MAAWTQAIGSIIAVLAAVWITSYQAKPQIAKQERAKIEQEIIGLNAVLNFTEWVQKIGIDSKRDIRKMAFGEITVFDTKAQAFVEQAVPVQNIPVQLYGSVETMNAAFLARDASRTILSARKVAHNPG